MIAIFGNLSLLEVVAIAALAVIIFGKDLPRVAAQVVTHVQRARRSLQKVWRESGIGDEIRQVQREIERSSSKLTQLSPHELARKAVRDIESDVRKPLEEGASEGPASEALPDPEPGQEADAEGSVDEPAGEKDRKPPWYPETADPVTLARPEGWSSDTAPEDEPVAEESAAPELPAEEDSAGERVAERGEPRPEPGEA